MLFRHDHHAAIRRGEITVTFRRWKRPAAKPGGRYRIDPNGAVEVLAVETTDERSITDADARAAGYADRASLTRDLLRYDTDGAPQVYRITFRYVCERDPRLVLGDNDDLSPDEANEIMERLHRMDTAGPDGAWTRDTLAMIAEHPAVVSTTLADHLGRERFALKSDIRKLKALGLTISLEVGYTLSPRGHAILQRLDAQNKNVPTTKKRAKSSRS